MCKQSINSENRNIWDENASVWDEAMGCNGNSWHRELVAPTTLEFLEVEPGDTVLDVGCGNGVFARRLSDLGAVVTAVDFSSELLECARSYPSEGIRYESADATDYSSLVKLGRFRSAVANMVLMDIPAIEPMFKALNEMLCDNGLFVMSIQHPCFNSSGVEFLKRGDRNSVVVADYNESYSGKGDAIEGQPLEQYYFHRSISTYLECAFRFGFILDGFHEPVFQKECGIYGRIPPVLIMRLRKHQILEGNV